MASITLTKDHLDEALTTIGQRFDGVSAEMTDNTRDIIRHFTDGQSMQNERIDGMDAKLRPFDFGGPIRAFFCYSEPRYSLLTGQ